MLRILEVYITFDLAEKLSTVGNNIVQFVHSSALNPLEWRKISLGARLNSDDIALSFVQRYAIAKYTSFRQGCSKKHQKKVPVQCLYIQIATS